MLSGVWSVFLFPSLLLIIFWHLHNWRITTVTRSLWIAGRLVGSRRGIQHRWGLLESHWAALWDDSDNAENSPRSKNDEEFQLGTDLHCNEKTLKKERIPRFQKFVPWGPVTWSIPAGTKDTGRVICARLLAGVRALDWWQVARWSTWSMSIECFTDIMIVSFGILWFLCILWIFWIDLKKGFVMICVGRAFRIVVELMGKCWLRAREQ